MTEQTTPRYSLDARIATGGMGEVWKATDTVLDREVAVKLLKPEYADDAGFRSRFESEARHAAALHHPNVAAVFDFGELPDQDGSGTPRPYLVMELVPGQPLSTLLRGGEPMPPETAAGLVAQAADAVAAAHALGIVHRDIKPANLLVTPDGTVKITDFGIARAADAAALTATGQVLGTPQYLSPEQAEGKSATAASDIYALGVVLYECLAGRRPFQAETPILTALAHLREEPPPLPDTVPAPLREATMAALAKDPAARVASAADLATALRGGPLHAGAVPPDAAPTLVGGAVPGTAAGAAAAGAAAGAQHYPGNGYDDGTRVMTAPPLPPEGTTSTPTGPLEPARRRGLPGWLPWAAAAAAVLLVVFLVSVLSGGSPDTSGSTSSAGASDSPSSTPSQSSSPSPSPSQSPTGPSIRRADYLGMPHDQAKKQLESLGYHVQEQKVPNPGDQQEGTVADVSPTGHVDPSTPVTLSVWDKAPAPAPQPKHAHEHGHGKGKKD